MFISQLPRPSWYQGLSGISEIILHNYELILKLYILYSI